MLDSSSNKIILLSSPTIGEEEKRVLNEVVDSGWITMGDRVVNFENAFAKLHGADDAVAVTSCTAGLHLVLRALNIEPGDEVLVPSLTFVATVNAILYIGARPVFVDINDIANPLSSLEDAKFKLTKRTKAVIVMHYGGYLADMHLWKKFCEKNNLKLIEDAAHAPAVDGVAHSSDAAVFSFFSNKNMTTAEGGMIISKDTEISNQIRRLRAHGMSTDTLTRHLGHAYSYDVTMLGYNYRMDELRAALGMVQLKRLVFWNQKRNELSNYYRDLVKEHIPDAIVPFNKQHITAAHLMPLVLPEKSNRNEIMKQLREHNIQTSIHYPPVHNFTFYKRRYAGVKLPKVEKFSAREVTLPLHPSLTNDEVRRIVESLRKAIYKS